MPNELPGRVSRDREQVFQPVFGSAGKPVPRSTLQNGHTKVSQESHMRSNFNTPWMVKSKRSAAAGQNLTCPAKSSSVTNVKVATASRGSQFPTAVRAQDRPTLNAPMR